MKGFIYRCLLFIMPFLIFLLLDLVLSPLGFFHFRIIETLSVVKFQEYFTGPYYPNKNITRSQVGGLAYRTPYQISVDANWQTDRYGYRTINRMIENYPVIIVGDSDVFLDKLDQNKIFSTVLEKKLNLPVYPLAPTSMEMKSNFLRLERFAKSYPQYVILVRDEKFLNAFDKELKLNLPAKVGPSSIIKERETYNIFELAIYQTLDNFNKYNFLNFLKSRLREITKTRLMFPSIGDEFFLVGKDYFKNYTHYSDSDIQKTAQAIKQFSDDLKKENIILIFVPSPAKENIMYNLFHQTQNTYLTSLKKKLDQFNVISINSQELLNSAFKNGVRVYHKDDNHWNDASVEIITEEILKVIKTLK